MKLYLHKSNVLIFFMTLVSLISFAQQKSTGINNANPSTNAALDIKNTTGFNQGLLIPRLPSTVKTTWTGLSMTDQGLMFYGLGTDSLYYWTGTKWLSLASNGSSGNGDWTVTGNVLSLTDTNANFLGSNNNYPLIFKTNGQERMRISRFGNVAIGKVPVGGIPLQVKSNSNGVVFRLEAQSDVTPNTLFDLRETPSQYGRMVLYDPTGGQTIQLSADPNFPSYVNNSNFGIGVTTPEEALHLYRGNILMEGVSASPTAVGGGGIIKFKGADFTHAFVNDANSDLTMWLFDGSSWRENVKFVSNGEFQMGKLASSTFDFMVDKYGNLSRVHGVNYSWPTSQGTGVLTNDGAGILTWAAGGSGLSGTGSPNTVPYWTGTNTLGSTTMQTNGTTFGIGIAQLATVTLRISSALATSIQSINTAATGEAVYGISYSTTGGVGVHGVASGGRGVYGQASSVNGIGGFFEHSTATSAALVTGVGRVGIGTSSPTTLLHVFSATTNAVLMLDAPSASAKGIAFANAGATDWSIETVPANGSLAISNAGFGGNPIMFANNTGFMGLGITPPLDALHLGAGKRIRLTSFAGSSGGLVTSSTLGVLTKVNFTGLTTDVLLGDGTFGDVPAGAWTKTGTSIHQTVLTDNVGIGITTPANPLEVNGITRVFHNGTPSYSVNLYSGTGSGPRIGFSDGSTALNSYLEIGSYAGINNIDTKDRDLRIFSDATTQTIPSFSVDAPTGNVGVGTANPVATLHVSGNIAFSPKSTGKLALAAGFSIDPVSTYIRMNATGIISSSATNAIIDGSTAGQILILHNNSTTILFPPTITIQDAANTKLAGSADFAMGIDDVLILIWDGADWLEISRSNN